MATARYSSTAIALHWSIAALIVIAFALGLTIDEFPKEAKSAAINAHALIGLAILVLSILRLSWRVATPPPPAPASLGRITLLASGAAHAGLYVLMIAIPAIGVPTLLYRGRGLDFGLFSVASPFERTPEIFRPLTDIHEIASYGFVGLAVAHALAALYHHRVLHDGVLLRMLPGVPNDEG